MARSRAKAKAEPDEPQCVVVEYLLPQAVVSYHGPGSQEACDEFRAQRAEDALPRGVGRRDLVVVELSPLPSS